MPNPQIETVHIEQDIGHYADGSATNNAAHRRAIVLLLLLLFVTSIANVYTRHQHRLEYVSFNNAVKVRDELNIEWNQLLVEESLWSFPHRVEKDATRALAMKMPSAKEIVLLGELSLYETEQDKLSQHQSPRRQQGGSHD